MTTNQFELTLHEIAGQKVINFANNSDQFIEVVFTINNKDAKFGLEYTPTTKGYAYTPRLEKEVKKLKDGSPLPFGSAKHGEIKAYIFKGEGSYHEGDIDVPSFFRHQLAKTIKFKRTATEPFEILSIKY